MFPGSNAITYTDATPTVPELWPKLVVAVRQVAANRFTRATHLILSPLAWGWLRAALDTAGWPLFAVGGSETGMNAMGTAQGGGAGYDVNGRMLGCDVVISGNVPETLVAARMRPASSPQTCATCTCGSYPPVLSSFELSSRTPRASASATWRTGTAPSAPAIEGDLRLCPARE